MTNVVGSGTRLFEDPGGRIELVGSRALPSGVLSVAYAPKRSSTSS